jgi:hypothetical protein
VSTRRGGRDQAPSIRRWPTIGRRLAPETVLVLVLLTGCDDGTPPDEAGPDTADPDGTEDESQPVASDPDRDEAGVSDEACPDALDDELGCIHLGSLVDRSDDPSSSRSDELLEGQRDFWARVNADGGVGGHEIHLADHVRDVTGEADEQVAAAEELLEEVLAFATLPGDATSEELVDTLRRDTAVGALPGWWSGWHAEEHDEVVLPPAEHSACLGAAVGLDWYAAAIEAPVSVLGIAAEGRRAEDVEAGASMWAQATGADWLGLTETATLAEGDLQDAAVQAIREQAPDVVVLGTAPPETAELVGKAAAHGFEGTFLGVVNTWDPGLLDDAEQAQVLQALYLHVGPWDDLAPTPVGAAITEARGEQPLSAGYLDGWLSSYSLLAALQAAADQDELTRSGVQAALDGLEVDHQGALPSSEVVGVPEPRAVISAPDRESAWGLSSAGLGIHGIDAERFDHPADCAAP